MRQRLHMVALLGVGLAAGGCALKAPPGADELRSQALPHVAVPGTWTARGAVAAPVRDDWLHSFNDPQLDALVREAQAYNLDLAVAAARVEQAAAYAKLSGSALYPTLNLVAHGGGKGGGDGSGISGVWLLGSWELDLWGRVRSEREAGRLQYESALRDAAYAQQSIAALVAKGWVLAVEARLLCGLAADTVRASEQVLGLARDRLRVGPGDEYEVALAQANLESARDTARQAALGYEQALRALEVLVGRYPAADVAVAASLPAHPGGVPGGLPSELLERRPDVIAAERRVAAAFNRIAEARAAQLPKIALTAGLSNVSSDLFVLQSHSNPVWSLGANLVAPIFNGYALQTQVEIRTAEQKMAVAEYGRIGARAFGEVEAALSAGFAADEREAILARAVASNVRSLELAQVRYKVGSGDLRAVLQQSVALYVAQTSLLRVKGERLIQRVNLYLALGGSFDGAGSAAVAAGVGPAATAAGNAAGWAQ